MKKNLLIFTHGGGRLANQMTNHAHLIAFQEEYKEYFEVINLAFAPYSNLFQKMKETRVQYIPGGDGKSHILNEFVGHWITSRESNTISISNQILRLYHFLFSILPGSQSIKYGEVPSYLSYLPGTKIEQLDLNGRDSIELLKKKSTTILAGWPVRSWILFYKYQDLIRSAFEVRQDYVQKSQHFISGLRERFDIIVGVLIRQDDYKEWMEGKFYFETELYVLWMSQVLALFPNKKVCFVVASNGNQVIEKFSEFNVFFSSGLTSGKGHFIESFSDLTLCDYVMTPPSTFGIWAAFMNRKPIIALYKKDQTLQPSDILSEHLFDSLKHPFMSFSIK